MLLTPSLCHKLSQFLGPPPPSSVTYFMDGPTSGGAVELEAVTTERGSRPLGADNKRLETQTSLFTLDLNSPQTFAIQ